MLTTCKQHLGVAPWRMFSMLNVLFIMMFITLWYNRGTYEFAESIRYLWRNYLLQYFVVHKTVLSIKTAFNLVKIHLFFCIRQWSVIIFVVHVVIVFGRLKYTGPLDGIEICLMHTATVRIHSLMYTACYPIKILTFLCEL